MSAEKDAPICGRCGYRMWWQLGLDEDGEWVCMFEEIEP